VKLRSSKKSLYDRGIFWDENGTKHIHNRNWVQEFYQCSNKHEFQKINVAGPCPGCGKEPNPNPTLSQPYHEYNPHIVSK
jgi:hypothetical protein